MKQKKTGHSDEGQNLHDYNLSNQKISGVPDLHQDDKNKKRSKFTLSILLFFILFSLAHCGGGTQVLSPPSPVGGGSVPTALRTTIANYIMVGTLPPGWSFQRLSASDPIPETAYNDNDPNTNLEAFLLRGNNRFSFFSFLVDSTLPLDQALLRFIQSQHPSANVNVVRDTDSTIPAYTAVVVDPSTVSNHIIMDAYYAVEGLGISLHLDVSGSSSEITQVLNEFQQIMDSVSFERIPNYAENESVDRLLIGLCSAVQRCDNTLRASDCLDAMDFSAGNQVWDQFGASWPQNSLSSNEVRQRANAGTVTLQSPAYENCLSELGALCTDSFRMSAGSNFMNAENLFSPTRTPSCGGVIRN